jgi:hypothetical protein
MPVHEQHDANDHSKRPAEKTGVTPKRSAQSREIPVESGAPRPKVMARLPDLNVTDVDRHVSQSAAPKRRSWKQRISAAALLVTGTAFVVIAVSPYLLHRDGGGGKSPAPNADMAPAYKPSAAPASQANSNSAAPKEVLQPNIPAIPDSVPPVSIPALPASIPDIPEGIMGPAAGPSHTDTSAVKPPALPSQNDQGAILPSLSPLPVAAASGAPIVYPTTPYAASYAPAESNAGVNSSNSFQGVANQPLSIPRTAQGPNYDHSGPSLR